jgi:hypothetical protein
LDGEPNTSCVVLTGATASEVKDAIKQVKVPSGLNQKLVHKSVSGMFTVSVTSRPGVPAMRPSIELEVAVAAGAASLICEPDKRTSRARAAIGGLVGRGVWALNDGWLSIP